MLSFAPIGVCCVYRYQVLAGGRSKGKEFEDFRDLAVSYSFDITKNDHDPVFCDYGTVIIP